MVLKKMLVSSSKGVNLFHTYISSEIKLKKIIKDFDFYNIKFFREEYSRHSVLWFQYPKGNMYWYMDFEKEINKEFINDPNCKYKEEWVNFLELLKENIKEEVAELMNDLNRIDATQVLKYKCMYNLRDYQAFDLCQFLTKYLYGDKRGLILSDPRTGKTRIALAAAVETVLPGNLVLVVGPKTSQVGWIKEIKEFNKITNMFSCELVSKLTDLKLLTPCVNKINIRLISYDLFKRLSLCQIRQLTSRIKDIMLICDEIHRLRNFKTMQSDALFNFKTFCKKDGVDLGIVGLTGTIAVKENTDVFGTLCFINEGKIQFNPHYNCFDCFKEYFYYCEDTSFGKVAKALRREDELNYIIQSCSVQTKQKELPFFQNYKKVYKKVELALDTDQKIIYDSVYNNMEYDDEIDCQNKLVQLVRLQQICIDPYGLVSNYARLSPKLKWVLEFERRNKGLKFIVACKKTQPLKHLMKVLTKLNIQYTYIMGECPHTVRMANVDKFMTSPDCPIMLLQLDTGREALTLPVAKAIVFLDRDFAQGFNEQAEARITPVDGKPCAKYIIDLVMKGTKEEMIYNTLVVKKESIDAVNTVFKVREE